MLIGAGLVDGDQTDENEQAPPSRYFNYLLWIIAAGYAGS